MYWQETTMVEINKPQDNQRANADAAIRKSADAMQQGGHATADALRQNAEVGADVARRGSEAGADAVRRGAELANDTARRSAQAVAETQRQIAQDAAQRFEEVSRKVAEATKGTTENVRQLMALPNAAEGGLRDLQQGVTRLVRTTPSTKLVTPCCRSRRPPSAALGSAISWRTFSVVPLAASATLRLTSSKRCAASCAIWRWASATASALRRAVSFANSAPRRAASAPASTPRRSMSAPASAFWRSASPVARPPCCTASALLRIATSAFARRLSCGLLMS